MCATIDAVAGDGGEAVTADLSGRAAVVTGAARGLGRAIALRLAREGACVTCADMDLEGLKQVASQAAAENTKVLPVQVDVSIASEVKAMIQETLDAFGKVDILINNAAIWETVEVEEMKEEQWDRLMAINLKGSFLCCREVIRHMKANRFGRIVNMASIAGRTGGNMPAAHYAASKGGVIAFTRALARESAPFGIRVNAVAPGVCETPLTQSWPAEVKEEIRQRVPLGRLGRDEDIAGTVAFLVSEDAGYVTGAVIDVNGGLLMA